MTGFDPAAFRAELRREAYAPPARGEGRDVSALTDDDRFLIAEGRRIAPVLRGRIGEAERLAGQVIERLADLAERLAGSDDG